MRSVLRALGCAFLLGLAGWAGAQAAPLLPAEPDEFDRREVDAYYDWRSNLFFRVFKLAGMEAKPNFMTARRTYKVSVNQYGYEVAMTFAHPLFYWIDLNGNGEFEPGEGEMWIDVEEDGLNGNEKTYDPMTPGDAPSGPVPAPPLPRLRSGEGGL
jgi:hypothetical protein